MKKTDETLYDRKAPVVETARQERAQRGGNPELTKVTIQRPEANAHPERPGGGADKASADNDLTTGQSTLLDGGADTPSADWNCHEGESVEHEELNERSTMATNAPAGDNHRNGAVRKRTQLKTKVMGEERYTKRSKESGQFVDQKADSSKFKGVRKEKS